MSAARRKGVHAAHVRGERVAVVAIVTVSDTRGPAQDESGARAQALLEGAGHRVMARAWVRDEVRAIRAALRKALREPECDAVVLTGGTGLAARDVTPQAVEPLLEHALRLLGRFERS